MDLRRLFSLLALVATIHFSWGALAHCQQPSRVRSFDGWRASPVQESQAVPAQAPPVQTAFYQGQRETFTDVLPVLPTGDFSNGAGQRPNVALPPLPSLGQNPTGPGFSPAQGLPRQALPPSYESPPIAGRDNGRGATDSFAPMPGANRDPQVLPATLPAQPAGYRTPEPQGNALRTVDESATGLRPIQSGRVDPRTIATGLPYVTPAPGRYPTSPYNQAIFQTAAYQRTRQAQVNVPPLQPNGQFVNTQLTQARVNSAQPTLPQYATPGIYPTSYQCAPQAPSFPTAGAVPGTYVPPTYTPNLTPGLYSPNNSGYAPLLSLGQENFNVMLGRGILGQPTVYVAGQPVRNFMRYLSP